MVLAEKPKIIEDTIGWREIPHNWEEYVNSKLEYFDCRLFVGDQGSGKSISTIMSLTTDIFQYVNYVVPPQSLEEVNTIILYCKDEQERLAGLRFLAQQGKIYRARQLTEREADYLEAPLSEGGMENQYDVLHHMRIYNNTGEKSKIVSIPDNFIVLTPVKIFANRTLYGIGCSGYPIRDFNPEILFKEINSDSITNCWILTSESAIVGKNDPTSHLTQFMKWLGQEGRKRHIKMAIDMPYDSQLLPLFHLYRTTRAECEYDALTTRVSLDVNISSPVMESMSYISYPFRKFFFTNERAKIPEHKVNRALKAIGVEI